MLNRKGFTIIELLMVVMIIGILASIAVPRLRGMRDRAHVAGMSTNLRSFSLFEEGYYYDIGTYTDDVSALESKGMQLNPGVTIVVNEATMLGWSATATHESVLDECYIFVGGAAPLGTAVTEGSVVCG